MALLIDTFPSEGQGAESADEFGELNCLGPAEEEPPDGVPDFVSGGNWLIGSGDVLDQSGIGETLEDVSRALSGRLHDLPCTS